MDIPDRVDEGGRIYLRALQEADVDDAYLSWFQDQSVTEYLEVREITHEEARQYILEGRRSRGYFMYGVFLRDSGLHIGNLKVGPVVWPHLVSDLVTVIGRRECWGKGFATEAIRLGNKIAFEHLGLRKLSGGIVEGNTGSVKAYTSAGWVIEGRLKGQYLVGGEARDRIVVACYNPAFFPGS